MVEDATRNCTALAQYLPTGRGHILFTSQELLHKAQDNKLGITTVESLLVLTFEQCLEVWCKMGIFMTAGNKGPIDASLEPSALKEEGLASC